MALAAAGRHPEARPSAILSPVPNPLSWFRPRTDAPPVPLVLYTKAGCGLCEELKHELAQTRTTRAWRLEEVDIERDPQLVERFGLSIPVLTVGGRVAFKGRMTRAEFERKFARLAAEWDERGGRA